MTYNKFNDIDGGTIRTESRDSEIEAASEELFGLFLAVEREIWVDASATVHSNSPTAHFHSLTLSHTHSVASHSFSGCGALWTCCGVV